MESVATRVSKETKQYLDELADDHDTSVSDVTRTILRDARKQGFDTGDSEDIDLTVTQLYEKIERIRTGQQNRLPENTRNRINTLENRVQNLIQVQSAILRNASGVRYPIGTESIDYDQDPDSDGTGTKRRN